jgi:hypothetical protein
MKIASGLVDSITEILEKHNMNLVDTWTSAALADDLEEVSKYWKYFLANIVDIDTIEARTHLDPTMDTDTWLLHFELAVIPILHKWGSCDVR